MFQEPRLMPWLTVKQNDRGTEHKVIGSIEELINEINISIKHGFMKSNPYIKFKLGDTSDSNYNEVDLHKDFVDDIVLSSKENLPMKREKDIIDDNFCTHDLRSNALGDRILFLSKGPSWLNS